MHSDINWQLIDEIPQRQRIKILASPNTHLYSTCKQCIIQYFSPFAYRLIRPVGNSTDRLTVKMGLKLSQIIGVDMKRQILITNVWLEQVIWLKELRPMTFELIYFIISFRNGSIISSNGILQTTGTFATCMYLLSIFGYQTLCSTISEYDVYTMGDTLLFCCWRVIIMISISW